MQKSVLVCLSEAVVVMLNLDQAQPSAVKKYFYRFEFSLADAPVVSVTSVGSHQHHLLAIYLTAIYNKGVYIRSRSECPTADQHLPETFAIAQVEGLKVHPVKVGDDDGRCTRAIW